MQFSEVERNPTMLLVVALALKDQNGRWLMQRRPVGKHHGGLWEYPGGKVENGETPRDALVREIREELEIDILTGDLEPAGMADGSTDRDGVPIVILLYTCRVWQGEPKASEGAAIDWFTSSEVQALDKPPLDQVLCRQLSRNS